LAESIDKVLIRKVVQLHVGLEGALPNGSLFTHPASSLVLLYKVLVAIVDLLCLASLILGRLTNDNFGFIKPTAFGWLGTTYQGRAGLIGSLDANTGWPAWRGVVIGASRSGWAARPGALERKPQLRTVAALLRLSLR
jgi:hypothetical protein